MLSPMATGVIKILSRICKSSPLFSPWPEPTSRLFGPICFPSKFPKSSPDSGHPRTKSTPPPASPARPQSRRPPRPPPPTSPAAMTSLGQSSSLQRLHNVEKRVVRVLELAGSVMEELGNSQGPRADAVAAHCREFMLSVKEIQTTLREEIKSACEYRPFEKCDYSARIANEICCKKLEYVIEKMDAMQLNIEHSTNEV